MLFVKILNNLLPLEGICLRPSIFCIYLVFFVAVTHMNYFRLDPIILSCSSSLEMDLPEYTRLADSQWEGGV